MNARTTIVRLFVAIALLMALPSGARAHEGNGGFHAPVSVIQPAMNTEALRAATEDAFLPTVFVSNHADDHHDCTERGCKIGQTCTTCFSALAPTEPALPAETTRAARTTGSDPARAGRDSPHDGPPPKSLT